LARVEVTWRSGEEAAKIPGPVDDTEIEVNLVAKGTPVANVAFDVTPARLVTGLITERGVCPASEAGIRSLFPEKAPASERV
jgi:methylthioribose-1-phosphate isomerase